MTDWADLGNGAFELGSACFSWLNVRRLWRDWELRGYDWRANAFFTAWGAWNIFYYPGLSQWASLAGGVCIFSVNACWVTMAVMTVRGADHPRHTLGKWRSRCLHR